MKNWGIIPNEATYVALMRGSRSEDSLRYFQEMIAEHDISPCVVSYGALIKSLVND